MRPHRPGWRPASAGASEVSWWSWSTTTSSSRSRARGDWTSWRGRCVRSLERDSRRLEIGEARCRNARRVLRFEPAGRRGDAGIPAAKLLGDRRRCSRSARSSPADRLTIRLTFPRVFSSGLSRPRTAPTGATLSGCDDPGCATRSRTGNLCASTWTRRSRLRCPRCRSVRGG